jgi:hypothetical protein
LKDEYGLLVFFQPIKKRLSTARLYIPMIGKFPSWAKNFHAEESTYVGSLENGIEVALQQVAAIITPDDRFGTNRWLQRFRFYSPMIFSFSFLLHIFSLTPLMKELVRNCIGKNCTGADCQEKNVPKDCLCHRAHVRQPHHCHWTVSVTSSNLNEVALPLSSTILM